MQSEESLHDRGLGIMRAIFEPGSRAERLGAALSADRIVQEKDEMTNRESMSLPMPAFAGGTKAITMTPVIGKPRREYAEVFIPGEEPLEDGELRVTVLGSGNPWPTRAQASASVLVEVGNPERDLLVFDLGTGSLANYASLKLPVNKLNKVFITHLHADHMGDLITLSGSFSKVGRADGPVSVWGPSGTEPRLGTRHFVESIEEALAWDTAAGYGPINPDSMKIVVTEFDFSQDPGRLREERREGDVVSRRPLHQRRRRLSPRLRRSVVRLLRRRSAMLAARACLRRRRPAHPRMLPAGSGARGRVGSLHREGDDRAQCRPYLAARPPARCSNS